MDLAENDPGALSSSLVVQVRREFGLAGEPAASTCKALADAAGANHQAVNQSVLLGQATLGVMDDVRELAEPHGLACGLSLSPGQDIPSQPPAARETAAAVAQKAVSRPTCPKSSARGLS
jgi:hypothetical protein